jgi:hypothetical protein
MNFSNYFTRSCFVNNADDSLVSSSLCASTSFSKDSWIAGLFLPNTLTDFQCLSFSVFFVEDYMNGLFNANISAISASVLSSPFQISFRGNFFFGWCCYRRIG